MIFCYKYISVNVTEQIVDKIIIIFAANFKVMKMKINKIGKLKSYGCCNYYHAKYNNILTTYFERYILVLPGFYTI